MPKLEEDHGQVINFDIPTPGLDKWIEENDGNTEHALKALWMDHMQEMEWKDYAIGANKSIMKLTTGFRKVIPAVRDACGKLAHAGFKDDRGLALELSKSFQELVDIGGLIKQEALECAGETIRHIKRIRTKDKQHSEITYECGHTEDCDTVIIKNKKIKIGQKLECPTCVKMLSDMQKSL